MAWTKETNASAIIDSSYGAIENWEDAAVNWNSLTEGKFPGGELWTKES